MGGLIRLIHPFPSILNGVVVAGVAMIAAGDVSTAARLGVSMTALQASIGALNDLVDAPADAGYKPGKPIPRGLVSSRFAANVVAAGALAGLALAFGSGLPLVALAAVGLAIGYGYDLVAKGSAWSWLPFAIGIPILPLYGWLGAAGSVPDWFAALLPMAVLIGAAIAIANARADLERDVAAGRGSVAVRLGLARSWWVGTACLAVALAVAFGWLTATRDVIWPAFGVVVLGSVVAVAGSWVARAASPATRERGWQALALGVAIVAVGWVSLASS